MESTKHITNAVADKPARPVHRFTIPKPLANGVASIGLVALTAREEMQAAKRGGSDAMRIVYEQVLQSLVEVNEEEVGLANGSADSAFEKMAPQVRQLVLTAYQKLHNPSEDATRAFLESQQVKV
jgi:hypothetical protein